METIRPKDDKINKVIQDFSLLPEDKQNYVLGILQALVFAGYSHKNGPEPKNLGELDGK